MDTQTIVENINTTLKSIETLYEKQLKMNSFLQKALQDKEFVQRNQKGIQELKQKLI